MTCRVCRRQVERGAAACPACGASRNGAGAGYELVLGDRTRVPLVGEVTIGRAPGNGVQLADPSVSRVHARITARPGDAPLIEDAGSSYGTLVDGRRVEGRLPLRDGARIALGDQEVVVERHRGDDEAGRTVLVPPGATVAVQGTDESPRVESSQPLAGTRPRLRSGYALKRLEAAEGERRWVLRDLVGGGLVRLGDEDAGLLGLVDGKHTIPDLVREAEDRLGPRGPARLARLLADLGGRGLLAGLLAPTPEETASTKRGGLVRPRRKAWAGAGEAFERLYRRGGWLLFTRPALAAIAVTAVVGLATFGYLVAARYGTPFVVARKIGLGGLVFLAGRLAVAALHETAHGLTMASFGRRVGEAGVKLVLIFPYTYVDTSDAWFEPRRRRIAISAAGPASDLLLGGTFALVCLATPGGTVRDVFFQLAFGAYFGALFNLNPLLERDGYQILADVLRQPGLRRRALEQLRRRLAGRGGGADSRLLDRYAVFALGWTVVAACFALAMSLRYQAALAAFMPRPAVLFVLAAVWAGLFAPALGIVVPPLRERLRGRTA